MKHTLLALVACLCLPCVAEEAFSPTSFSPGDPQLVVVERDARDKGLLTRWRGTLQLRGNLVFEFSRLPPEQNEMFPEGATYFEPDETSLARLPAALNNHPTVPRVVRIQKTPREVLMPILGIKATNKVVNGKGQRYLLPVRITVTEFSTSLDCDNRSYALEYVEIAVRKPKVVAQSNSENLSC